VICLGDTERSRALFYADEFRFLHLDLHEPFRPMLFEDAAVSAQRAGAAVWVCDSFSHEHVGPGGVLDWHEEELHRLAGEDDAKRERVKMLAWVKPKVAHKHMLQRMWQLNCHIILCCQADRKTELVKIEEGRDRGKIKPVDRGYQPICGSDIPYAMTCSFLFSTAAPGVPQVIKPLMPALKPLISLDRPIDEATGAAIAAWASGGGARATTDRPRRSGAHSPPAKDTPGGSSEGGPPPSEDEPPGVAPEDAAPSEDPKMEPEPPPEDDPSNSDKFRQSPTEPEPEPRELKEARRLAGLFVAVRERREHLALVDDKMHRTDIEWLKRNRKAIYDAELAPAIKASWARTDPNAQTQESLV